MVKEATGDARRRGPLVEKCISALTGPALLHGYGGTFIQTSAA